MIKKLTTNEKDVSTVAIKVENLSKTFKIPHEKHTSLKAAAINMFGKGGFEEFEALKSINFEVKKGEFFGIIGRNGSGKSTLLKILAGIYVPDKGAGKVTINGKLSPFLELGVGFNPELTGRENLFLGGCVLGLSRKEVAEKFDKIVRFAELEEFIDMKLKNYSSGMQVRLAFSLSINAHAEILLMDEVLAVGDTNFQSKCLDEFNKYRKEGKTVLLVTHDISTVQRYCDRVMLLKNGKIFAIGDPDSVCNQYFQQNIEDFNQDDIREKKNNTLGKASITSLVFKNNSDKKISAINTLDDLVVRVSFNVPRGIGETNFGLALFTDNGQSLIGLNTFIDTVNIKKYIKQKYFEVTFRNIPIRHGKIIAKAGIWGENPNKLYDFFENEKPLQVVSVDRNDGMVLVNYEWN